MKKCPSCQAVCLESNRHCPGCGADVRSAPAVDENTDPYTGTTLAGKYHINELLGVGAMGRVYRADHLNLDAQVAVKLLNPEIAADPQAAKRFHTEARAASRLRHPNTIQILDFGQAEHGALYIVMEMLRGRTLAKIIEGPPIGPQRIADLLGQALGALDEAHAVGIIHRDFKPDNIFVENLRTGREHVKVLDFGIAKLRGEAEAGLTSAGAVCGTPEYMSPEQIRGEDLDPRSDVYAAGVVLYEMLCGVRPFESSGPVIDILTSHLHTPPPPPSKRRPEAKVPSALEAVCMKALSKQRDQRYRSADELKQALDHAVRGGSAEHCAQCGVPLPGTARFCPQCGATLRQTGSFATTQAAAQGPTPTSSEQKLPSLPLKLVGREAMLERLESLDQEALLLIGDAGIGKSALAEAWLKREEGKFRRVASTGPDPSGASVPLYPLRQLVARLLDLGGSRRAPANAAEVERACSEHPEDKAGLLELFGFGGPTSGLPLDARFRECNAAVLATVRRSSASILVEDVERFDDPSRRVLASMVAEPGDSTIVCTATIAEALEAEIEVLRLGPLAEADIEALGLPAQLHASTGGVPFAVVEWVRARAQNAEPTIEARLQLLPGPARALLEAATVAGAEVPTQTLVALISGGQSLDSGRAIAELSVRGWLRLGPARTSVELASPTLRRRVYEAMGEERRRELHGQLAETLAAEGHDPIVVAHHAVAGTVADAATCEAAGDAARELFDDDAAGRWFRAAIDAGRRALQASGYGGGGEAPDAVAQEARQVRVALKLAAVLRYNGESSQAESVVREALLLAERRQDRWAEVQARRSLARLARQGRNIGRARDELVAAVGAAMAGGERALLAELYLELAEVLDELGDIARASGELYEGILICTAGDGPEAETGPEVLWRMVLSLAHLTRRSGDLEQARHLGQHALRHAERVSSSLGRARAHALLADVHQALGDSAAATESRRKAAGEMRRVGDRRSTAELLLELADPSLVGPDAKGWLREAAQLSHQVGWTEGAQRAKSSLAALG
jgi:serine/threonine-protein kinase